ncbi:hypothetical protein [Catellatospora methionotrophica]|uniref:hypothetical protein n=1 Tax=Catellatospora methionotrophica TaxID=121620 RepID=UPI0033D90F24
MPRPQGTGAHLARWVTPLTLAVALLAGCDPDTPPAAAPAPSASADPGSPPVCPSGRPGPAADGSRDPFAALGARQVPGPAMTPVPVPAVPTTQVMQRPASPDEGAAALQPNGRPSGRPAPSVPAGISNDPACLLAAVAEEGP